MPFKVSSHKAASILSLSLVFVFLIFIANYESYSKGKTQEGVAVHAQVVASSVWTLFTPASEQYLKLAVRNSDYKEITIKALGDSEIFSVEKELEGFEKTLLALGLIRIEQYQAPVVYKDKHIGQIEVRTFNKNIYLYSYLAIILLLSILLIWFIWVIYDERKNLRFRVAEKTAELANSNQVLQAEIVERKNSEKALLESEQTFLALFDQSFQFIALLTPDGRVVKINKTALSFRNLSATDVIGDFFWDTPWWKHSQALIALLKEAFATARTGQIARFEAHSTAVQEVYLDVSLKPVLDDAGEVLHVIAEARDITDLRRAELDLQQAQKMESVGTLAGGIAHDFNNILAGILGTLTLLKLKRDKGRPIPEADLYKHLDTVSETALRAKGIVNQLLTLSRKHDLTFSVIDLHQVLERVCQIANNSFDKSICIDAQFDKDIPVFADANSLEQVFLNICINAAHAMTIMRPPEDAWGGTLKLRLGKVRLEEKVDLEAGDYWQISLEDSGVGMNELTQNRIFVPFYTTKEKDAGSGLGLAMVYNIIKQHRGVINVESQEGRGSIFQVYLPICRKKTNAAIEDSTKTMIEPGQGLVLIIDDEELIRSNASEILTECGYRVITAENGQKGIELYRQHQEDIYSVLLDLVMPVMSGKETFAALKALNPEVKVLLSSGFRHDSRVDEILAAGAFGFIQKPYSLHHLSRAIKNVLG